MTDIVPIARLRCSGLPLVFLCSEAGRRDDGMAIDHHSDEGSLGSATHAVMETVVSRGDVRHTSELDIAGTAASFDVDPEELGRLVWYGIDAWRALRPRVERAGRAVTEMPLRAELAENVLLSGHMDVFAIDAETRTAYVIDWKTGRVVRAYYHQLMGYAWLVFQDNPDVDQVEVSAVWLRESEIQGYTITREQARAWQARLVGEVVNAPPNSFTTGGHCVHCPRADSCPALTSIARRDAGIFGNVAMAEQIQRGLADLSGPEIVALHRRSKIIRAMCDSLDTEVKRVVRANGSLDAGDGTEYRLRDDPKRELDALRAWPVLQELLTPEELATAIKLSISKLETAVAAKAPKRGGAAAKRELARQLEEAGAVLVGTVTKLVESKKPPTL
jgi:hypothetical protein